MRDNSETHSWFGNTLPHDQFTASITEFLLLAPEISHVSLTVAWHSFGQDPNACLLSPPISLSSGSPPYLVRSFSGQIVNW